MVEALSPNLGMVEAPQSKLVTATTSFEGGTEPHFITTGPEPNFVITGSQPGAETKLVIIAHLLAPQTTTQVQYCPL